jgi:hypothetical protein
VRVDQRQKQMQGSALQKLSKGLHTSTSLEKEDQTNVTFFSDCYVGDMTEVGARSHGDLGIHSCIPHS